MSQNEQSMPIIGRVFLAKLRSFSCDASKKSLGENDGCKSQQSCKDESKDYGSCSRKVARSRCGDEDEKKCEETRSRRKDACGRDSRVFSRNDKTCEKQEESESESCERYACPELRIRKCNWEKESEDPSCSRKQDNDKCSQSKVEPQNYFIILL